MKSQDFTANQPRKGPETMTDTGANTGAAIDLRDALVVCVPFGMMLFIVTNRDTRAEEIR
jgi:hypothetical protein